MPATSCTGGMWWLTTTARLRRSRTLEQEGIHVQYVEDPEAMPADFREAESMTCCWSARLRCPDSPCCTIDATGARTIKRLGTAGTITQERRTLAVAGTHREDHP